MFSLRHVPWLSSDEFAYVTKCLRDKTSVSLRAALAILHVWVTRLPPSKIPRAITCTHDLLVSYFEESHQSLALALMRIISPLSSEEQDRDKPYSAQSLTSLSANAGFPPWIADLRNDVAHGSLPSVPLMEHAFSWALDRLDDFWHSNLIHIENAQLQLNNTFHSACRELNRYVNERLYENVPHSELSLRHFETALNEACLCTPAVRFACVSLLRAHTLSRDAARMPIITATRRIRSLLTILKQRGALHLFILQFFLHVHLTELTFSTCMDWCSFWLDGFNKYQVGKESEISRYLDDHCMCSFDWRRVFQHVLIAHSCPKLYDLCVGVLDAFRPPIPDTKRKNVLSYLQIFLGLDNIAFDNSVCHEQSVFHPHWTYSEELWADCALGALSGSSNTAFFPALFSPDYNAAASGKYKGFSAQDAEGGRKVRENKGE
ncbi:unnamed protein product [Dicrocoelium dendriticum]|nr:unnamed protein product [Dicrocoelium dendriticum]